MGLAEPSPPAPLAHTNKMSDAEDAVASSPLPVSSCGEAVLSPAEKEAGSSGGGDGVSLAAAAVDGDDAVRFRGRDLPPVGQDPLAAAAAKISETAHRAAELTLGAVMPPGITTTEDLVRASKEGLWSALSAARGLAAGAVAAAAQASDAAVEGTRQQYHAVVEAAKEAVAANNSSLSFDALESFRPEDGSAVLGAFEAEFRDEVVSSSSSLFPPAPRRIRGALFVTSSSVLFLVSRAHQALGRAVSRAVTASAAEASSASLGTASSELGGFLGAALAAEDAERAAREAEEAAGLPAAGTVAAIPLGAIGRVEVVRAAAAVAGESNGGSGGGDGGGVGRNALVVFLKEGRSGNESSSSVTFSGFGAPSDADEALALVEHLLGEGKEGEEEAEEKK